MPYRYPFLLALLLAWPVFAWAQNNTDCYLHDPNKGIRERNFDMQHMLLEVRFEPEAGLVLGEVSFTFEPLLQTIDSLFLDGPGIEFKTVAIDGRPAEFTATEEGAIIYPSKPLHWETDHELAITYEAWPRKGLYFIGWNAAPPAEQSPYAIRKQIWTQGQGIDNRHWFPSFDDMNDKLITELVIHFDEHYQVLSNGVLLKEKSNRNGTKMWHYKITHPHPPYLVMLGIGKYAVKTEKSKGKVKLHYWYYPEFPDRVEPTYRHSAAMMDWMEAEFGVDYPWTDYAQIPVQNFMYGAMENTTATVFGDFYFMDERAFLDRSYVGTNAHELAHQWFGDYVTGRSREQMWLQESFATHYQKHFERSIYGEDHFQWNRRRELGSVLAAAQKNRNPIVHTKAGGARIYPKGSLVLDMLKYLIGREQFNKALAHYLRSYPYKTVDTHQFFLAFFETLGINLDWFFDQWLFRGGEPHYKVSHQSLQDGEGSAFTQIEVEQAHEVDDLVGYFKMPIVFQVHYKDGSSDERRVWIENQHHTVVIPNEGKKEVAFVLFDPNHWLIKTVDFPKPLNELMAQASNAPNMIDRYDALQALAAHPVADKREALIRIYQQESFHATKAEIIKQLVNDPHVESPRLVKAAIKDQHDDVRRSTIYNVDRIAPDMRTHYEMLLTDEAYRIIEEALKKLSEQFPENIARYVATTQGVDGVGNSVAIARLEIASQLDMEKSIAQLVAFSSPSWEFRTRRSAFEALKRLNYLDEALVAHLFDGIVHFNRRLAGPATKVTKYFMDQTEYRNLIEAYVAKTDWEDWQREIIREKLSL